MRKRSLDPPSDRANTHNIVVERNDEDDQVSELSEPWEDDHTGSRVTPLMRNGESLVRDIMNQTAALNTSQTERCMVKTECPVCSGGKRDQQSVFTFMAIFIKFVPYLICISFAAVFCAIVLRNITIALSNSFEVKMALYYLKINEYTNDMLIAVVETYLRALTITLLSFMTESLIWRMFIKSTLYTRDHSAVLIGARYLFSVAMVLWTTNLVVKSFLTQTFQDNDLFRLIDGVVLALEPQVNRLSRQIYRFVFNDGTNQ